MELEYLFRAVGRFRLVVVASIVAGIVFALVLAPETTPEYESTALLLVVPGGDGGIGSGVGDRYISSQLVVLESPPMTARALELADTGLSLEQLGDSVQFFQIAGTDVVRISAVSTDPAVAQAIANAYLDAYLIETESAVGAIQSTDATQLEESIGKAEQQLNAVELRIEDRLDEYARFNGGPDSTVPPIESIDPGLATERDVLIDTYSQLLRRRASLELEPQSDANDQVIQRAELPTTPTTESTRLVSVAIMAAFTLFGVAAATVLARTSRRVLDGIEVTETLGHPFAASIEFEPALSVGSLLQINALPERFREMVNTVSVQAEALGSTDKPLTILVTGSQAAAGTTTIAAALAAKFGERGSRVALLDLDFDHPELSIHFEVEGDGFAALLRLGRTWAAGDDVPRGELPGARWPEVVDVHDVDDEMSAEDESRLEQLFGTDTRRRDERRARSTGPIFAPTSIPNVSLLGREPNADPSRPQRLDFVVVLEVAVRFTDVVIIDGGPMLEASAAAVLAQHVDAVVVPVPVSIQRRAPLRVIARQLTTLGSSVLPVSMPRLRQRNRPSTLSGRAPQDPGAAMADRRQAIKRRAGRASVRS